MQVEVAYRPAHALARVMLQPNESVVAESGAMVGMTPNVQMQTQSGGLMKGLARMFGGESFFRNTFVSQQGPGEVLFAHSLPGDIVTLDMHPAGYMISSGAFIASSANVNIDTKTGGFRGMFSGAGLFMLKATAQGPGQVIVGAFGGIEQVNCDGNMVIDTGHLVAWDASLTYKIGKSGAGWIASWLSGEGLVCHFSGQGRIWMQSRNAQAYGMTIGPMLPPR